MVGQKNGRTMHGHPVGLLDGTTLGIGRGGGVKWREGTLLQNVSAIH